MDDWVLQAKCRNDVSLQEWINDPANKGKDFFHDKKYEKQAMAYCADCPVRLLCLAEANSCLEVTHRGLSEFPKHQGVMGGTNLRQRRAAKRKAYKKAQEFLQKIQSKSLPPAA